MSRTRKNLDPVWKEALTAYLPDFLALFLPTVHQAIDWTISPVFLESETRSLRRALPVQPAPRGQRRQADLVVKVHLNGGQEALVLLHVEVQSQRDPHFALRMSQYHHRLVDRHGLPVFSLAVLGDAAPGWRPCYHQTELWGCRAYFRFATLKLLDWKERRAELEASTNPFALVVAAHLAVLETRPDQPARLVLALRLVRLLLQRGFTQEQLDGLFPLLEAMIPESKTLAEAHWGPSATCGGLLGRAHGAARKGNHSDPGSYAAIRVVPCDSRGAGFAWSRGRKWEPLGSWFIRRNPSGSV